MKNLIRAASALAILAAGAVTGAPAKAQMDPFLGQIAVVGFNFCPRGWAQANGQLLAISSNTALFSLLGTTYGGDGRTTFGLPDLQGRSAIGVGNGPGLSPITWGERGGTESITQTVNTLANHTHAITNTTTATLNGTDGPTSTGNLAGAALANQTGNVYSARGTLNQVLEDGSVAVTVNSTAQNTGGNQSQNIRNPFLGMYICIATQGIYPSRN